ncbi:hypothetical protein [Herbiconiux sp. L3-i23]|uniref:hypothetical protein n=1 Tax=Herbiconiux sp. L3-i23 TaxID=2905871 RepID=UPI0020737912|nr:hypothetical protein [Herbiconiux sp. L3-i23]
MIQLRGDISVGRIQLRLVNEADSTIEVTSARLVSPLLGGEVRWTKAPARIAAGATVDLPFLLPVLDCIEDAEPLSAVLQTGTEGGDPRAFTVIPDDPLGALARLEGETCLKQRVAETVEMTGSSVEVTGSGSDAVARLTVSVRPTGGGAAVVLDSIRSTVLLTPRGGEQWPLGLVIDASSEEQEVVLDIVPRRCDAHALGEDKVGTVFPVVVDGDGSFPLPLADGVKNQLLDFVSLHCGLGAD